MSLPEINFCPSLLRPGFTTYCAMAEGILFGSRSRKVSHLLPFGPPGSGTELIREYNEKRKRISISGVQEKYSLHQYKNELSLTAETGTHILKPVPAERLARITDMPANEHVTMQMASQLFGIRTAASGMIFFADGSPAYITRRFDYKPDGTKYQLEDFATLLSRSPEKEGEDFKYNASYLDIANEISRIVPAAKVDLIRFFELVLFNYLVANGDAHLKNFSLMETVQGDYILSPAYDLLCTALHIDDANLGLHGGLYDGDMAEKPYQNYGIYTYDSFRLFAGKIGIQEEIATGTIDRFMLNVLPAMNMIDRSFLSPEAKVTYKEILGERHRRLMIR